MVLRVDQEQQQFVFTEVASQPVPSLLRDFSAPVKMEVKGQSDDDLVFLLAHDTGHPFVLHASLLWFCLGCTLRHYHLFLLMLVVHHHLSCQHLHYIK